MLAATSAAISARPPTVCWVPEDSSIVGAGPEVLIGLFAFHTLTVSGGTVTFTEP